MCCHINKWKLLCNYKLRLHSVYSKAQICTPRVFWNTHFRSYLKITAAMSWGLSAYNSMNDLGISWMTATELQFLSDGS